MFFGRYHKVGRWGITSRYNLYLDLNKNFEKVPHQRLLLKLKARVMGNGMTNWLEKWLIDRRQWVVVDGEVSNWKSVLRGVLQGSVLGPILFLIYINDLEDDITKQGVEGCRWYKSV